MANDQIRIGVIMAGGSGERFWPLSRKDRPKQLLRLTNEDESMLGEAVSRLEPLIPAEHIYVATGEHLVEPIQKGEVGIPDENVIAEPAKRNTAGCLVYAAAHMLAKYGGDGSNLTMAVVTADHLIQKPQRFRETVEAALEAAEQEGALVTHGVVPDRPETGYGYIQADDSAPAVTKGDIEIYRVRAFHEKPSREKADEFIEAGNYYWNSGMFFWRVDSFMSELERVRPDMAKTVRDIADAIKKNDKGTARTHFESLEDVSIDYALMEHAKNVMIARADYPWDDVGSWPSVDRTWSHDENGNVAHGDPVLIDTKESIVFNAAGAEKMAVCAVGVKDLVIVVSEDGVLVASKDHAQDVRRAVKELKARGSDHV